MRRHGRLRLVPVAAFAWLTAYLCILFPAAAVVVAASLWTAAIIVLAVAARRLAVRGRARHVVAVIVLSLTAAAAAASHIAFAAPARDAAVTVAIDGGRALEVHAAVVGKVEHRSDGSLSFDAVATRIAIGDEQHAMSVDIVIVVSPDDVESPSSASAAGVLLDVGARVVALGSAAPPRSGERSVMTVRASRGVTVVAAPDGVLAATAGLRHGLVASTAGLPGPGAGLLPGLAVGDTSAVTADLDAAMKESSLSHLTAVSGANCALVVGIAFAAAAALGAGRRTRVVVGLTALAGFVVLVTPEPSVVRAATMAAIAMLGLLLGRPGVGMAVLSIAVVVLLVVDPWLAGSLGFALSAVATGSLLLFARPLAAGLERFLPRALALGLSIPLAAQLACGPLLVLINPTVPLYGVVANLLAAPAAPVATVVGLAACLAAPLPLLQAGLAAIAWVPSSWIAATAHTTTALPGNDMPWLEGVPGLIGLAAVGCAVGVLVAVAPGSRGRARIARISSGVLVALVVGITVGAGALGSVAGPWTIPRTWSVLACDVGQGDAVLLRSAGAIALVDTGPDSAALDACLARAGVDRIDLLVITHFDLDHVGGLDAVRGRVGTVLHGPAVAAADVATVSRIVSDGAHAIAAEAGMRGTLGAAQWRVLWPRAVSHVHSAGNDASVVLDVRGGGIPSALLLGDLSASPQRGLAASGALDPPYAIVKVAHHGSADQDPRLYDLARPAVAIVTVGDNDYGHPRTEALAMAQHAGARIARTDADGIVAAWLSDGGLQIWRERDGDVGDAG